MNNQTGTEEEEEEEQEVVEAEEARRGTILCVLCFGVRVCCSMLLKNRSRAPSLMVRSRKPKRRIKYERNEYPSLSLA